MEGFGFNRTDFRDQLIVDIGAGPKLRSTFFEHANIVVIEPLGDQFMAEISWCDLSDAYKVYSIPAEDCVDEICGNAGFVMCVNALDHSYDAMAILKNIRKYLKDDGCFLLSVDIHGEANEMHPISLNQKKVMNMLDESGFEPMRAYLGLIKGCVMGMELPLR